MRRANLRAHPAAAAWRSAERAVRRRDRPLRRRRSNLSSGCATRGRSSRAPGFPPVRRALRGSHEFSVRYAHASTCRTCPASGCSSITLMNEQPSNSGRTEPSVEDIEDGQQLLARIRASLLDLTLKPAPRPELVAALEECHHEVLLGGEVAIHRLSGYARSLDDRVDSDRLDAPTREQLVRRLEQPLARFGAAPVRLA